MLCPFHFCQFTFNSKESTSEAWKKVSYFTSTLERLFPFSRKSNFKFQTFKFHDVIKCQSKNKKHILLNNLESKYSLLMMFVQFMSYYTKKKTMKKTHKNCDQKASSRHFFFLKHNLYWKIISKTIKICPNQHTGILRFFFTEHSLKSKESLELVSRPHFS